MCGICGVLSVKPLKEKQSKIFLELLQKSEDRGHDAFGFYAYPSNVLFKTKGCVTEYLKANSLWECFANNQIVLAHNRASTIGTADKNENNHPFETKDFVLAHNGHIWNHETLREKYKTEIQTDSIVILKCIQDAFDECKDVANAIEKASTKIDGSYACWLFHKPSGGIYLFRHSNPIYVAYSKPNGMFVFASEKEFMGCMVTKSKVHGFYDGLMDADMDEDVIYNLREDGLYSVGKLSAKEYAYSCTDWSKKDIEDEVLREFNTPLEVIEQNFWDCGIYFEFDKKIIVHVERDYYVWHSEMVKQLGYTISPKTYSFEIDYMEFSELVSDWETLMGW